MATNNFSIYMVTAEHTQVVTSGSVAKVLTEVDVDDIFATSTSILEGTLADHTFAIDWPKAKAARFFQIQFDHNDENVYSSLDGSEDDALFDANVKYCIDRHGDGWFDKGNVNFMETTITELSNSPAGVEARHFVENGFEDTADHKPVNHYLGEMSKDVFSQAGTLELFTNENAVATDVSSAGDTVKGKLKALIDAQNHETNDSDGKTGKNNSTLVVGKLFRQALRNELGATTKDRVEDALLKWKVHDDADKQIEGIDLWEAGADGEANYLNVGAFLRVGDEFRIRIFLQVDGKPHGDGAVVFTAKDNNGNDVQKKHLSKIVEFVATIV